MIEQILKLKEGKKVAMAQYDKAKKAYEEAYANADDATRAKLDGLMKSSQNYSSADPMNNRSAMEYKTQMYLNAAAIANGTYKEAPSAVASTKNIFNGYSNEENKNNANTLTNNYLQQNISDNSGNNSTSSTSNFPAASYYTHRWDKGLDSTYGLDTESFEDKAAKFIDTLAQNLSDTLNQKNAGKTIKGVSETDIDRFNDYIAQLLAIKNKLGLTNKNEILADLVKIAPKIGVSEAGFKGFFGNYLPQLTQADKNKQARINEGYTDYDFSGQSDYIKDLLNKNQYHLMQKDNQMFAFDKDYNLITNPFSEINDDWRTEGQDGSSYGHGLFIDDNGNVFIGDTSGLKEGDAFWQQYQDTIKKYNRNNLWMTQNWDQDNSYSNNELINKLATELNKQYPKLRRYGYTDVGALFEGNRNVLAFDPTGKQLQADRFGNIKFDNNTKFAYIGSDGSIKIVNFDDVENNIGKYQRSGFSGESNNATGQIMDISNVFDSAKGLDRDTKFVRYNWKDFLTDPFANVHVLKSLFGNNTIADDPKKFFDVTLQALINPDQKLSGVKNSFGKLTGSQYLQYIGYYDDPQKVLATLGLMVKDGTIELTEEQKNLFNKYVKQAYASNILNTLSDKNGGTLVQKFAYGSVIDIFGEEVNPDKPKKDWHSRFDKTLALQKSESDAEQAKAEGYDDVNIWKANKNTKLTTADKMRIGAIAADVVSIAASFTGAGAGVAEATGIGSFATNTLADLFDPSVTAKETLKNTAIGAGLAAISFIPGARIPSTMAKVVKYAPKIMMAAGTLGIAMDESVHETFKKITDGKEKLNTKDWKNLAHVMMLVSAGTRGGRRAYEKRVVKNTKDFYKAGSEESVDVMHGENKIGTLSTKEQKDAYNKAFELANKGENDKAVDELMKTGIFKDKDSAALIIKSKDGWVNKIKSLRKKVYLKEPEKEWDYEKLAEAYRKAGENSKYLTWRQKGIIDATGILSDRFNSSAGVYEKLLNKITPEEVQLNNLPVTSFNLGLLTSLSLNKNANITSMDTAGPSYKLSPELANRSRLERFKHLPSSELKETLIPSERAVNKLMSFKLELESGSKPKITLSKEEKKAALDFAKSFGIELKSESQFLALIQYLKEHPNKYYNDLYSLYISGKPVINPKNPKLGVERFRKEWAFRHGGQINYQKLRQ